MAPIKWHRSQIRLYSALDLIGSRVKLISFYFWTCKTSNRLFNRQSLFMLGTQFSIFLAPSSPLLFAVVRLFQPAYYPACTTLTIILCETRKIRRHIIYCLFDPDLHLPRQYCRNFLSVLPCINRHNGVVFIKHCCSGWKGWTQDRWNLK